MKLAGWNGKVPVLSNYLMEEDTVFSFIVQGFSLYSLYGIGAVCNTTTWSRSNSFGFTNFTYVFC